MKGGPLAVVTCAKTNCMKKVFFFLSLIAAFSFSSCKKDKEATATQPAINAIPGVYRITGLKAQASNSQSVDVFNQLTECQKSDTWQFREDGVFVFGGAVTSTCQDGDFSGTWKLEGKSFTITSPNNTSAYQLVSTDKKVLILSIAGTLNNEPATYYVTFTK